MSKKELEELAKAWDERITPIEKRVGEITSSLQAQRTGSEKGGSAKLPIYKCKGKECRFATDNIEDYVDHVTGEKVSAALKTLEKETAPKEDEHETPKKRYHTFSEYLDCPTCKPKAEELLKSKGWTPPTAEAPKEKPKGGVELP